MDLNSILASEFAKITNDNKETVNEGATVYGTYRVDGDGAYVQIDGSDTRTPVATTASVKNGDRVTVLIKNHRAIITGNMTDPSASSEKVNELDLGLGSANDTITNIRGDIDEINNQVTGMAASIEGAEKVATNFISFEDPYGLIVGNLTDSTLGFNVLIDATSVNMRHNSTILAKYASDTIYLGYNNTNAVIDMCGGLGTIAMKDGTTNWLNISSLGSITLNAEDGICSMRNSHAEFYADSSNINIIISRGSLETGIDISADGNITLLGDLDVTGEIYHYAKSNHTHSQYYESGDNINVGKITSSYTYGDTVDYSTNMYVGTSGILHRTTKTSSRTVKHDIKPIENADILPEKLYDIDVIQFVYNEGQLGHSSKRYGKELPGFIVEDLVEKYPIAVDIDEEDKPFQWNEQYLIPPMLALIQKQKKKLDELESRINALEKKEV